MSALAWIGVVAGAYLGIGLGYWVRLVSQLPDMVVDSICLDLEISDAQLYRSFLPASALLWPVLVFRRVMGKAPTPIWKQPLDQMTERRRQGMAKFASEFGNVLAEAKKASQQKPPSKKGAV